MSERLTCQPKYRKYIDNIFDQVNARGTEISNTPEHLSYGQLTEVIHKPNVSRILIMSDKDGTFKCFMTTIASLVDIETEIVNSESVRAAET